jgi:hypothetical protein
MISFGRFVLSFSRGRTPRPMMDLRTKSSGAHRDPDHDVAEASCRQPRESFLDGPFAAVG